MRSSYKFNDYGSLIFSLVRIKQPMKVVEFGILDGYSTVHIAKAMKLNAREGKRGNFFAFDLFDRYKFKHGNFAKVSELLFKEELNANVIVTRGDFYKDHIKFEERSIDMLHVDISNDGDVLKKTMELWHTKMKVGGYILFEGGSDERDNVDWMIKHNHSPIRDEIATNKIINHFYQYVIFIPFPSMTLLIRR